MKYLYCILISLFTLTPMLSQGQVAIKTNVPFVLAGTPNLGVEVTLGNKFAINVDGMWMPYLFKKSQSVLRAFQTSADLRYYINPKYYHTNNLFDGFYLGPYAMYANYNVGFNKVDPIEDNSRYVGWGLSAGVTIGYKIYLSRRFRLDFNLGVGYAHLQHDVYQLGSDNIYNSLTDTKVWIGPTKFGIHLVYNINK